MTTSPECPWCERPFRARRGGSPQRFCGAKCRMMFWSALRRWGEQAVASGLLTIADIKIGAAGACTLLPGAISPSPVPAADATVTLTETPDFKAAVAEATAAALADAMPRIIAAALIAGRP